MPDRLPPELRSDAEIRRVYDEWQRQRMGELAAPDRYGAMAPLLPRRLSQDPAIDQVLRKAGPGYHEGQAMGSGLFYDAAPGQKPPPLPPTLQQQPAWVREPVNPDNFQTYVQPPDPAFFDPDVGA